MIRRVFLPLFIALAGVNHGTAAEYVEQVIAATFKLYNTASTGTGIVIDIGSLDKPDLVLVSAAHAFKRMAGNHCLLVLREPQKDGGYSRRDVKIAVRRYRDLWHQLPGEDVAALRLTLKPKDAALIRPLKLSALADSKQIANGVLGSGDETRMLGYPQRFESNGAGFPVIRQGVVASHPLAPVKTYHSFLLDVTTFSGDSGGPVVIPSPENAGNPLIVGIVLAQHFHDEKIKVSMREEKIIKHQLGVATILHADFVRRAIARLP
jgi:hypothetical protein